LTASPVNYSRACGLGGRAVVSRTAPWARDGPDKWQYWGYGLGLTAKGGHEMAEEEVKSLINIDLGNFSKPATVLIQKISDAIGALYRPMHIVRIATAEAEAARISAQAAVEVSEIQQRGLVRMIEEQGLQQANIERISVLALPDVKDDAKPENIDSDWLRYFFAQSRIVSGSEMQSLWARLLAGEANSPGSFSRRTLAFVSSLDKQDAELFTALCKFAWMIPNETPLIYDQNESVYQAHGLGFDALNHLAAVGLVTYEPTPLAGFVRNVQDRVLKVNYFDKQVIIELPTTEGSAFPIGQILLTRIGQELAPISGATRSEEFFEYVLARWRNKGYQVR